MEVDVDAAEPEDGKKKKKKSAKEEVKEKGNFTYYLTRYLCSWLFYYNKIL